MNIKSYLRLLPRKFRRKAVQVVCIGVLRRLLDLIGLAALLPIIVVILDPGSVEGDSMMAKLFQFIGLDSLAGFGITLGIFALLFVPLKSVFTIWLGYIQNKYYLSIYKHYSKQLYGYYHSRGLLYIRQTFSTQLAFHINGACYGYAMSIVGTILNAAADLIMTMLLTAAVVWYAPQASLMLFSAIVPVLLIYFLLVKKKLNKIGLDAYEARRKQTQIVQESLKGHISLNINDSFDNVSREFERGLEDISKADLKSSVFGQIPSAIMQMCIAIALIILLIEGSTTGSPITLFVLFGFAAVKIMPSILSLAGSWNTLQNSKHIIDIIQESEQYRVGEQPDRDVEPMKFEQDIELREVTFAFEGDKPVLEGFSLKLHKGESVGFRGRSGKGKSTLFNLLLGFYTPQSGGVYIDGEQLTQKNVKNWHKIVGYCEQEVFIINDSLARNVSLSAAEPDEAKVRKVLEQVGLREWVEAQKDGLDTKIGESGSTVSGGERQRIGIARALYKDPQVLFIDESTSALDIENEENIIELLHSLENEVTLLIISHRESALRHCHRIIDM